MTTTPFRIGGRDRVTEVGVDAVLASTVRLSIRLARRPDPTRDVQFAAPREPVMLAFRPDRAQLIANQMRP